MRIVWPNQSCLTPGPPQTNFAIRYFGRLTLKRNSLLNGTNSLEEAPRRNGARPYPRMLPQPFINILRPIVMTISRLLWGVQWRYSEEIPPTGGLIIASNHQTYIDPFWVGSKVKRPVRFLAWDAAFSWPLVGRLMRLVGAWPLQLEKSDPAAIRNSLQWIREGGAVVIFPEGGRGNPDGSMIRFKAGAVRMAMEAGVPILPVTIRGGHRVWPSSTELPRLTRGVEIIYHPPMVIEQHAGEDVRECARRETQRLAEIIRSSL
jgi:1-acyl-sn-glycerol-3-phosphate acyltransferase